MQEVQLDELVMQFTHGEAQFRQVFPLRNFPGMQLMHVVAEEEQVAQGEVQAAQIVPLK